jgi:hypothetical protein
MVPPAISAGLSNGDDAFAVAKELGGDAAASGMGIDVELFDLVVAHQSS